MFFCEKAKFATSRFQRGASRQSEYLVRQTENLFSGLRDSKHKNNRYGARKQGQMENRLKRKKGKKRKET